ncbi:glycosyltransferase family 1 protein [filamentous cyanobacterium CCT1]|nr:glycosyltransferase family 1 protein [filamentous cyanobacterium CCT1]PSN77500.1 glycosyltransferase family 1 protein [filamentous cyanobacterium CCP4]
MRIAYVCADPGIPVFGQKGCSIHVQEVIRALRHQGATVELFAVRWGGDPPADLADIPLHALPPVPKGDLALRETAALGNNYPLRAALEQADPFDAIYERYSLWSHSAMDFAQAQGIAALLEVNAPLIEEQAQHRGLIQHRAARRVAERVFQSATAIIAVSEEVKQYLSGWVSGDRVRVIPNGVNHHRFAGVPFSRSPSSTFTVGFVGSLKPWHGLTHLVNAFEQLYLRVPQARLLIVGDGPERDRLEVQLVERRLQAVARCTGAVPPDRIPALLAQMDVAVAPYPASPDFYFSPLKVVEYMAAGLPVVVSDIGQLRDLVVDGVTGWLCPPGDEKALAIALERLWRSPDLRCSLGRAARQQVLVHHTWDGVAEQILAIARSQPVGYIRAAMHH